MHVPARASLHLRCRVVGQARVPRDAATHRRRDGPQPTCRRAPCCVPSSGARPDGRGASPPNASRIGARVRLAGPDVDRRPRASAAEAPGPARPTVVVAADRGRRGVIVLVSLLMVVAASAYMTQGQVRLTRLQAQLTAVLGQHHDLEQRVAQLSDPSEVVSQAQHHGLVAPEQRDRPQAGDRLDRRRRLDLAGRAHSGRVDRPPVIRTPKGQGPGAPRPRRARPAGGPVDVGRSAATRSGNGARRRPPGRRRPGAPWPPHPASRRAPAKAPKPARGGSAAQAPAAPDGPTTRPPRPPVRRPASRPSGHRRAADRGAPARVRAARRADDRRVAHAGRARSPGGIQRRRIGVMRVVVVLVFAALALRLIGVQVFSSGRYSAMGARRGRQDGGRPRRCGAGSTTATAPPLALSVPRSNIVADPFLIHHPAAVARALTSVLGRLDRDADGRAVRALGLRLPGEGGRRHRGQQGDRARHSRASTCSRPPSAWTRPVRWRPRSSARWAAEGSGQSGLEYQYNSLLAGQNGTASEQISPDGVPLPGKTTHSSRHRSRAPASSSRIDEPLQYVTEQSLGAEILASHAKSGIAIVMNTHTGEILSMANLVSKTVQPPTPKTAPPPTTAPPPAGATPRRPRRPPRRHRPRRSPPWSRHRRTSRSPRCTNRGRSSSW